MTITVILGARGDASRGKIALRANERTNQVQPNFMLPRDQVINISCQDNSTWNSAIDMGSKTRYTSAFELRAYTTGY